MEETFNIEEAYAYYIHRIDRMLGIHFQNMVKKNSIDVTIEQWFILSRLYKDDGISQVEISDKIFKDKANITRMIDGLEKKALVVRKDDATDRRKFKVYLTKEGRELTKKLMKVAVVERKNIYKGLDQSDLRKLKQIINVLETNILDSEFFSQK